MEPKPEPAPTAEPRETDPASREAHAGAWDAYRARWAEVMAEGEQAARDGLPESACPYVLDGTIATAERRLVCLAAYDGVTA